MRKKKRPNMAQKNAHTFFGPDLDDFFVFYKRKSDHTREQFGGANLECIFSRRIRHTLERHYTP